MGGKITKAGEFILDILFPRFCVNCGKEGNYLCEDCFYLIDIFDILYCPFCRAKAVSDGKTCQSCERKGKKLSGLFCATSYENPIIKKLVSEFKYPPYVKDMAKTLSFLIIMHLINSKNILEVKGFSLVSVPLHKSKLRQRGYNQSEELAKELSKILKIPVLGNVLAKNKKTPAQMELKREERLKNIYGTFACVKPESVKNQKILLVDDVFTTGSTMEECASVLKSASAGEVRGIVLARGF